MIRLPLLAALLTFQVAAAQTNGGVGSLPGTCTVGTQHFNTATGQQNICTATNTWTALAAGGGAAWGTITGTLSNQTDLQTALDLKANLASPSFTGTVTMSALSIATDTSTGLTIGTGGTQKLGFWGVTPVVRPSAYTQTYSTASKTLPNQTSADFPAGGTGAAAGGWSSAANRDLAITRFNALRVDVDNVKKVLNQVIDDLQAMGILQ